MLKRVFFMAGCLLVFFATAFSQSKIDYYNELAADTDLYFYDTVRPRRAFMIPADLKLSAKDLQRYSLSVAYSKKELLFNDAVYIGWTGMEDYLNRILANLLPDSVKSLGYVHVYPARIPVSNAFVLGDGSIFFNVGLFDKLRSESSVAIVLAHELGHYLLGHHLNDLLLRSEIRKRSKIASRDKKLKYAFEYAQYSREQELAADSIGFLLAAAAGYNLSYGIDNFYRYQAIDDEYEQKLAETRVTTDKKLYGDISREEVKRMLVRYPENTERIDQLILMMEQNPDLGKAGAVEDSALFRELFVQSTYEKLNILLKDNVRECVRQSFALLLTDPSNDEYLYFQLESLRRAFLIYPSMKGRPFLTDDFFNDRFKEGQGILHDVAVLFPDSTQMADLPDHELIDSSVFEFETYDQAWDYFAALAIERRIIESYLTIALSLQDTNRRNTLLTDYLSFSDCKHSAYASALKSGNLYKSLLDNQTNYLLFDQADVYFHSIDDYKGDPQSHTSFIRTLSKMSNEVKCKPKVLFSGDYIRKDIGFLFGLLKIQDDNYHCRAADTITVFDPETRTAEKEITPAVNAFVIDPENWEFAEKYDLRTLRTFQAADYGQTSEYFFQDSDFSDMTVFWAQLGNTLKKPSLAIYKEFLVDFALKQDRKQLKKKAKK